MKRTKLLSVCLVVGAFALSARQNGGTPHQERACQPELKICNTAVVFTANDGTAMVVRAAEDPTGNVVKRDICKFNKFGDVRVCTDWDTGASSREMQNSSGQWYKVGNE